MTDCELIEQFEQKLQRQKETAAAPKPLNASKQSSTTKQRPRSPAAAASAGAAGGRLSLDDAFYAALARSKEPRVYEEGMFAFATLAPKCRPAANATEEKENSHFTQQEAYVATAQRGQQR